MNEVMISAEGDDERVCQFSDFCIRYVGDAQFRQWSRDLDAF